MYMHGHFNNNNNNNNNICPICTYRIYIIIIIIKITFLNSQLGIQKSDFLGHRKRKSVFLSVFSWGRGRYFRDFHRNLGVRHWIKENVLELSL